MLKNAYFLKKKNCKNRLNVGGYALEPLFASGGWGRRALFLLPTITALSLSFLAQNAFYYP